MRALLIAKIDAILPQTQCRQCGFSGCEPYATAIADGLAEINQCPPGGEQGIQKLAELLGVSAKPLNSRHGAWKPKSLALIDEKTCIGCTLCIQACPVDAIVGASRKMHTVLSAECTGCELCIPSCPMDCITMVSLPIQTGRPAGNDAPPGAGAWEGGEERGKAAARARLRYRFRSQRLEREKREREENLAKRAGGAPNGASSGFEKISIQEVLQRATMGRTRATEADDRKPGK
jgi:Na+-translocating ferredoxin:NAD+ oxidoreductase subunit B